MAGSRRETRVERGIYRNPATGAWRIYVSVAGRLIPRRLPATWSLVKVRSRRAELEAIERGQLPRAPVVDAGTFADDARLYLEAVRAMPTYAWRAKDIALWVEAFGPRRRHTIRPVEIDAVLQRWLADGYAPSTVRHRRTALMHLWTRLDGRGATNPVKDTLKPPAPEPEARHLPYGLIRVLLRLMPPSKTRARLAVMAWTGLAQSQLARLEPGDVDLEARVVWVRARRKGQGARGFAKPLTEDGVEALRAFAAWDAWGPFSRDSMKASFRRACHKLALGGLRPYDLRHSYATAVYAASGDIRATQAAMGHGDIRTTMRYARGAVDARVARAIDAFGQQTGRKSGPTLPTDLPDDDKVPSNQPDAKP